MKTIGIVTNRNRDDGLVYTRILVESVNSLGGKVSLFPDIAAELGMKSDNSDKDDVYMNSDTVICLGGDGTFLKAARNAYRRNLPILGINLGSLGFLTEIEKNDIRNAVECVLDGRYRIEERMMLETMVFKNGDVTARDIALNDVVISRGALSRILHIKTYINNVFVDSFPGDGLIVSSPTGSTAYSLSAGGPIVEPDIDLIIVSPICPHILYSRSFITAGNRVVKAVVDEGYSHMAMVTVDGQNGYEICGGDCIEIRKAQDTVRMIRINSRNFFSILRTKIYDRGENLRKNEI